MAGPLLTPLGLVEQRQLALWLTREALVDSGLCKRAMAAQRLALAQRVVQEEMY
jgi:hypothetical protein